MIAARRMHTNRSPWLAPEDFVAVPDGRRWYRVPKRESMARRPHIVIFNPDQWRGDVLGHAGNPAAVTPHTDRFAREIFLYAAN